MALKVVVGVREKWSNPPGLYIKNFVERANKPRARGINERVCLVIDFGPNRAYQINKV